MKRLKGITDQTSFFEWHDRTKEDIKRKIKALQEELKYIDYLPRMREMIGNCYKIDGVHIKLLSVYPTKVGHLFDVLGIENGYIKRMEKDLLACGIYSNKCLETYLKGRYLITEKQFQDELDKVLK